MRYCSGVLPSSQPGWMHACYLKCLELLNKVIDTRLAPPCLHSFHAFWRNSEVLVLRC